MLSKSPLILVKSCSVDSVLPSGRTEFAMFTNHLTVASAHTNHSEALEARNWLNITLFEAFI